MLKAILGEPAAETRQDGTLLLRYNSPFIGADEDVSFHLNGNILRKVTWSLYSD
jgi:hypothetical protein